MYLEDRTVSSWSLPGRTKGGLSGLYSRPLSWALLEVTVKIRMGLVVSASWNLGLQPLYQEGSAASLMPLS